MKHDYHNTKNILTFGFQVIFSGTTIFEQNPKLAYVCGIQAKSTAKMAGLRRPEELRFQKCANKVDGRRLTQ